LIVTTRPGTGTVFRVELPLSIAPPKAKRTAPETIDVTIRALNGFTFVIIEDNAEILNSLTRLLRSWGAEVVPSTGYNAQLIKRISLHERIDAIVADHNLGPHSISGVEAVFKIRELVGVPIPTIMLTAVQRGDVIAEFQRVMGEYVAAEPGSSAIARSPSEEPIVLQKPTTAAVLNKSLGELLGLTTLPVVKMAIPPPAVADAVPPRAATG
jgi:CheY-like chemotaxis protein